MKSFDYEKKIYGTKEKNSFSMFTFRLLNRLPEEFKNLKGKGLDIGCGAGLLTQIIKKENPELDVYAIDISKRSIEEAEKNYSNVHYLVADVYKLPFGDNSIDAVTMFCVLEHLEKPEEALREVRRVLKKNGLFFSITPIEGDKLVLRPSKLLSRKYHGHVQRFSKSNLLTIIKKNDFKIKNYYFWGYFLCQVVSSLYLNIFNLLKMSPSFSIKGYIDKNKKDSPLSILRNATNVVINFESLIVPKKIRGIYMFVIARK